jgi:phosphohistidine swiveling domain-containing protein
VAALGDDELTQAFERARRYGGKGCLNAADNVQQVIAPHFEGRNLAGMGLFELDRSLLQLEVSTARRRGKLAADATPEAIVAVLQRKQNLGMNAVLASSLALARGIAHVRGRRLYELLREAALSVIETIAAAHAVPIEGSRFEDYVAALRRTAALLAERGVSLHSELRRVTGIYEEAAPAHPKTSAPLPSAQATDETVPTAVDAIPEPAEAAPTALADLLPDDLEQDAVIALTCALAETYAAGEPGDGEAETLRLYLTTKMRIAHCIRRFEIVNNRIFRDGARLVVPYLADNVLLVLAAQGDRIDDLAVRRFPRGTVFTDQSLAAIAGPLGEVVDLEPSLFSFEPGEERAVKTQRVRDVVALLHRLNVAGGRDEVLYHLRFAVARLCSPSFEGFLGAKNLQPEARKLGIELGRFLNGPFGPRLRLPLRILVRNVGGLLLRPKLIDQVWNDTIELAEVHLRGSAVANELRRSAHHALGTSTLRLARGYRAYLEFGDVDSLPADLREAVSAADEDGRRRGTPRQLVERVANNLEELLGTSQIATRIQEWMESYGEVLLRCESGSTVSDELEVLVTQGIRSGNRWSYRHHLRALSRKAVGGAWADGAGRGLAESIRALDERGPDAEGFDPEVAERDARAAVTTFADALREEFAQPLFLLLREILEAGRIDDAPLDTFLQIGRVRAEVESWLGRGDFDEQRYLLVQLDCLLEEMGYLCLRHVASSFEERGTRLRDCARVIHQCAANLEHDGIFTRELWDLSAMLLDQARTRDELLDVLVQVQRVYQMMLRRVMTPYETLAERLDLDAEELRAMLANFQRYMHDLNSVAHFADLARTLLQAGPVDDVAERQDAVLDDTQIDQAWDFLHLSHHEEVRARVEDRTPKPNLLDRYGGKGSGLLFLSYLRIPTRDGFILPTTLGRARLHEREPARLERELLEHVQVLERDLARDGGRPRRLGDPEHPLLLAVRGGSVFSMPGMLSTVVFVGMTDEIAETLARTDPWHAYDSYRRFLVTLAQSAWGLDIEHHNLVDEAKRRHGVRYKSELPGAAMQEVVEETIAVLRREGHGEELDRLLANPRAQLVRAVRAVLESWDGERVRRYREVAGLCDHWQTAVIVQEMASGNRREVEVCPGMDETRASLTGVIPHTCVSSTGFRTFTGDVKFHASGDDLVAGLTAPDSFQPVGDLRALLPMLERQLQHHVAKIRRFRGTDPEVEFTVDSGVLSILQARMANIGQFEEETAFEDPGPEDTRGIGVRGGAFRGRVAFVEADLTELRAEASDDDQADGVLLVLENPAPEEIPTILAADGLLTARGGTTSHAAVAVRGIQDRPFTAVLGASGLRVDAQRREATLRDGEGRVIRRIRRGEVVSIHGTSGRVFVGARSVLGRERRTGEGREAVAGAQP